MIGHAESVAELVTADDTVLVGGEEEDLGGEHPLQWAARTRDRNATPEPARRTRKMPRS